MVYGKNGSDKSLVATITDFFEDSDNYNEKDEMLTITGYNKALTLKKDIEKYEKYEGNLPEDVYKRQPYFNMS